MNTRTEPCPRCGRHVRLAETDGPAHLGQATLPDGPELVCLDVCCETGDCPLTHESAASMMSRLSRSALNPTRFAHVRLACDGCGLVAEMEVLDGTRARCTLCGAMNPWVVDELLEGVR